MSKEISQEELAEAYEHDADHPVAEKEDYEIPEDVLLMMHVQNLIRKSKLAHDEYLKKQAEIWGIPDENNK